MKSLFLTFKEPVSGSFLLIQHAKQDAKKSLALSDIYILQGKNFQTKKKEIKAPIFLAQDKCENPDLSTADINEKFYEEPLMRSKIIHSLIKTGLIVNGKLKQTVKKMICFLLL